MASKTWDFMNIRGYSVNITKETREKGYFFNAYVDLPESKHLHSNFLGHPTFRDKDTVGVDTNHTRHKKLKPEEKLRSAIGQITEVIKKYQWAFEGMYLEDE